MVDACHAAGMFDSYPDNVRRKGGGSGVFSLCPSRPIDVIPFLFRVYYLRDFVIAPRSKPKWNRFRHSEKHYFNVKSNKLNTPGLTLLPFLLFFQAFSPLPSVDRTYWLPLIRAERRCW